MLRRDLQKINKKYYTLKKHLKPNPITTPILKKIPNPHIIHNDPFPS